MKKRILSLFFAVCILCSLGAPAFADTDFNRDAMKGVVMVEVEVVARVYTGPNSYEDVIQGWSQGTGFFVGKSGSDPEYIITNNHVIQYFIEAQSGEALYDSSLGLYFDLSPSRMYVYFSNNDRQEAFLVDANESKDLAILRLDGPTSKRSALSLRLPDEKVIGSKAYALGYPSASEETVEATTHNDIGDISVTSGVISRAITESGSGRRLLQMDVSVSPGNSGGPLVDAKGNVLGVNTFVSLIDGNMNYAVSVAELIPMLDANNVPYSTGKGGGSLSIVAIAAGAAVLVLVIVLIIVKSKKKPAAGPVNRQAPGPAAGPGPAIQPMLRSLAPQHAGLQLSLAGGPVKIGRNSDCRVKFSDNTPGVSGNHCSVSFNPNDGRFMLTDLGSSYGTFLSTGQRLTVGMAYPLNPGDSFYLGDKSNMLRVEMGSGAAQARPRAAILHSLAPQHGGKEIMLNASQVLVGRDRSNCQLCFQENTPGVSGRHCSVSYDAMKGRFMLTDLGSTYGTFMANGQQLNKGVAYPLQPGDSFYLGDRANMLRVELR